MTKLLERLGSFAARRYWIVIVGWLIILGGLLGARHAWGGEYVNNYTVPGSPSNSGLNVLNSSFPSQGGYAGQIVFHARHGTVARQQTAVNTATANVAKLPDVIKAGSPFGSPPSGAVSKDGTIAYSSVSWNVNPASLEVSYLDRLNKARCARKPSRPLRTPWSGTSRARSPGGGGGSAGSPGPGPSPAWRSW